MHNDEIGIIDIELHGLEDVLNGGLSRSMTADEVFTRSIQCDLIIPGQRSILEIWLHNFWMIVKRVRPPDHVTASGRSRRDEGEGLPVS